MRLYVEPMDQVVVDVNPEGQVRLEARRLELGRLAAPVVGSEVGHAVGGEAVGEEAGLHGAVDDDSGPVARTPGHLGRADVGKVFLLNFMLYNKSIAERDGPAYRATGKVAEDCWPGTQARAVVAAKRCDGEPQPGCGERSS